jgi:hypothetical protein
VRRPLPDFVYPLGFFTIVIVIVALLWAVGDGRGPHDYAGEVRAARYLLSQQQGAEGVQSALRSLDPDAVEQAERTKEARDHDGK